MKLSIILLRGLPGAGKTTFAELLERMGNYPPDSYVKIFANDDYHVDPVTLEYKFDRDRVAEAADDCLRRVTAFLQDSHTTPDASTVTAVVHNTFTREWEMDPYYELAEMAGATVTRLTVENDRGSSSVHGIPESIRERMRTRFEIKL